MKEFELRDIVIMLNELHVKELYVIIEKIGDSYLLEGDTGLIFSTTSDNIKLYKTHLMEQLRDIKLKKIIG